MDKTTYRCIECRGKFYRATDFIRHHNEKHLVPEELQEKKELQDIFSERVKNDD